MMSSLDIDSSKTVKLSQLLTGKTVFIKRWFHLLDSVLYEGSETRSGQTD